MLLLLFFSALSQTHHTGTTLTIIASHKFVIMKFTLNEKVGFKIPTTYYCKNSILCGALQWYRKVDLWCGVELRASRWVIKRERAWPDL